jgi:hypothetical protein
MMYRRDHTGPADDFDTLTGDPWQRGIIHDRPSAMRDTDAGIEDAIARRREQLLMEAQDVFGPQENWAPITESEVYRKIDEVITADLNKPRFPGPSATMGDDFETAEGDPFVHGHRMPISTEDYFRYTPQSERDEEARKDLIATELWRRFSEQYPYIEPAQAERAAVAVAQGYEQQGTNLARELQVRGPDAVLSEIYDATYRVPHGDTQYQVPETVDEPNASGRTGGIGVGGHGGSDGQRQQQDDKPGDMIADLERMRPKWV